MSLSWSTLYNDDICIYTLYIQLYIYIQTIFIYTHTHTVYIVYCAHISVYIYILYTMYARNCKSQKSIGAHQIVRGLPRGGTSAAHQIHCETRVQRDCVRRGWNMLEPDGMDIYIYIHIYIYRTNTC